MADAVKQWVNELIDRTGRNRLLYYRHLKTGTLDLKDAEPAVLDRMLKGRRVRITQLFTDPEVQVDAMRRARAVEAKGKENDEERGIRTLYLAFGLATWSPKGTPATQSQITALPNAPAVIQAIRVTRLGYTGGDFELAVDDAPELNPVLLHVLAEEFQIDVDEERVLDGQTLNKSEIEGALHRLTESCNTVPGFSVKESTIIGNFSYTKLPMVRDIEDNVEYIEQDNLLAAIAGDQEARDELRERQSSLDLDTLVPVPPPSDEFIVLDADASQSWAIAAVLAGANLVIEGPPGTGKSQTIANLIAASVARGKSVLFVAEKRAAIDAVTDRLAEAGLDQMVLDLHGGPSDKRRVANDISDALAGAGEALEPNVDRIHKDLTRTRTELEDYLEQLHRQVEPWGRSVFQIQNRLLELCDVTDLGIRFDRGMLTDLSGPVVEQGYENLRELVERGGLPITGEGSDILTSVFSSNVLVDAAGLEEALKTLDRVIRTSLPKFSQAFGRACSSLNLNSPESIDSASRLIDLLEDAAALDTEASSDIYQADLPSLSVALEPARTWGRIFSAMFSRSYRSARTIVRAFAHNPELEDKELLALVEDAANASRRWTDISLAESRPETWPLLNELVDAKRELSEAIQSLGAAVGQDMNDRSDIQELESTVNSLESNRSFLLGYPNLHDLYRSLATLGLEPIIDAVRSQDLNHESTVMALEHAWLSSVLNLLWIDLPSLARFSGSAQDNAVKEFRIADENHVGVGAARVKRAWASTSVSARDTNEHESAVLVTQASLKPRSRQRLSLRELYREAGDVLTSVKPCWVMSPLVVAQVLPAKKCFDLVVFDEASQIPPADAVCALLRGRQTVVAGDPKQLPPTTFFASGDRDEEKDNSEQQIDDADKALNTQVKQGQAIALVGGQESLLDQMKALLPPPHGTKMLNWHYRSKCERLIAFSNAQEELYDWQLTSFPSAGDGNCVSHVLAPFTAGVEEASASASAEVQEVVALVIRHAEERPDQSLGVIALGVYHANRIEEQLRRELETRKDLEEFFEKSGLESFFIRNLERVQGDERDAIILTTGYSKTKDGRMRYSFGPINREGGYRRLNVAVTRAKLSMTVVSSFSSVDMDDERLNSIGPRMLRDYLLYAESGGTNLGRKAKVKPQMNPFERDVYEALTGEASD